MENLKVNFMIDKIQEELDKKANSENYKDREFAAEQSLISMKTLIKLSEDENECVRIAVVRNPMIPPFLLHELSNDKSVLVRKSIAENDMIHEITLGKLLHQNLQEVYQV